MAFSTISSVAIRVGAAIKKELWDKVKNNFDNHESRINSLELGAKKIDVMSFDVKNASAANSMTGLYYYEASAPFTLTDAFIRIYEKNGLSGDFEIDIKKSTTDLNGASFASVFTVKPRIQFSSASDYEKSVNQVFNPVMVNVEEGDFLRLDVTVTPTGGTLGKFLLTVYGE